MSEATVIAQAGEDLTQQGQKNAQYGLTASNGNLSSSSSTSNPG